MSSLDEPRFKDITETGAVRKRCDQILQEIQSRNGEGLVDTRGASKQELKDEYNQLYHQLEDLRFRPSVDPLAILPPEIWIDILREAATNIHVTDNPNNYYVPTLTLTDNLLAFTCVSHDWSTKLLNAATLWTTLTIGLGEADAQAKLGTGLCLSHDLHLKLTVHLSPCQWDEDLSLMLPHTNRILDIVFGDYKEENFASDTAGALLNQFFSSLGSLPALKTVRCSHACLPNWHNIFTNAPHLAVVHDIFLPLGVMKSHSGLLRSCRVEGTSSEIMTYIEDLAELDNLTWNAEKDEIDRPICTTTVPYLGLREIYGGFTTPPVNFFTVIKLASNLEFLVLVIQGNWHSLYDLFHIFPRLPRLQQLRLFIDAIPSSLVWPATENTRTDVRWLHIYYCTPLRTLGDQEALFAVLPAYFPKVTQFYLKSTIYSAGVAAFIRSVPCLRSLTLAWMEQPDHEVSLESPTLEDLTVVGQNDLLAGLVNFTCPLLSKISLDPPSHMTVAYDWSHHRSTYSHIKRLKIKIQRGSWEIHNLRALQKLQVEEAQTISGLLLSLIFDPIACPMLSELELYTIPEWDLLFIMLEQCNYMPPSQGISRIETVILPSPIPPILFSPLVELLAGRFAWRPSNWELSFSSIMDIYFDLSLPGCERCLRSLSICSTSTTGIADYSHLLRWSHVELAGSNNNLPIEVWEWLRKRKGRVDEWNRRVDEQWLRGPSRVNMCPQVILSRQPVIVTGHSLR